MIAFLLVIIPGIIINYLLESITKSTFSRIKWVIVYVLNLVITYGITAFLTNLVFKANIAPTFSSYDMSLVEVGKYLLILLPISAVCFFIEVWLQKSTYFFTEEYTLPKRKRSIVFVIITLLFVSFGFLMMGAARWYIAVYGDVGFDAILFTLMTSKTGVQSDLIISYVKKGLIPSLLCIVVVSIILLFKCKNRIVLNIRKKINLKLYPFSRGTALIISTVLCVVLVYNASNSMGFIQYIKDIFIQTTLYEEEYVNPDDVEIIFPEEKQNLIIIYMESMETTFFSKEQGGALDYNVIPELYQLAEENTNFSQNDGVGGSYIMPGATWTIGALVAYNSGLPLKLPLDMDENSYTSDDFLAGATTMMDVLDDAGYYQAFMVGSDMDFGGRRQFYLEHKADKMYDVFDAMRDDIIPDDYWVWWGMEDSNLYEYAKQELLEISDMDCPFAFSMLTVDTHHIGGYECDLCEDAYEEGYENVYACASKQLDEFISWCEQQDFYENTTIVIVGDHPSMDADYMDRNVAPDYVRRTYNCFINPLVESEYTKNRDFCTMDMFPTILAAIGCDIEGDRLGLGTNLFSGKDTLIEEIGYDALERELNKASEYYTKHFLLGE